MIRELGTVELVELCETIKPNVQCSQCLLCLYQGIVYCTCGQCLVESESRRKFHKLRLDALSIPHYVLKKGLWTENEPQDYSLSDYPASKKLTNLLRHGSLLREDDGAIEFWRLKDYLQNHFVHSLSKQHLKRPVFEV